MSDTPDAQTTGGIAASLTALLTALGLWAKKAASEKNELIGKVERLEKGVSELQATADRNESKLNALVTAYQDNGKLMEQAVSTNKGIEDILRQMAADDRSHREAVREKLRDIEHHVQ